jgi:hypothetical protein
MSDEQTAATLATEDVTETKVEAAVGDDGIIDLDAPQEVKEEPKADEPKDGETGEKDAGEDGKPKKPSGAQRAKLREQRLLNELQDRNREIEELRRNVPAAKTASGDEPKPPREEDFNGDFFAYQAAKTAFEAGQATREAIREDREAREKTDRETKQAEAVRERKIAHAERVEDAREVIADFDQVMEKMKGVDVRNELIDEIMASDKSALITYHLANNPDELNALNRMSGRELARAMGRLEATVKLPEAKKATSAPPPLSRPNGGANPRSQEADLQAWLTKKYGTR